MRKVRFFGKNQSVFRGSYYGTKHKSNGTEHLSNDTEHRSNDTEHHSNNRTLTTAAANATAARTTAAAFCTSRELPYRIACVKKKDGTRCTE